MLIFVPLQFFDLFAIVAFSTMKMNSFLLFSKLFEIFCIHPAHTAMDGADTIRAKFVMCPPPVNPPLTTHQLAQHSNDVDANEMKELLQKNRQRKNNENNLQIPIRIWTKINLNETNIYDYIQRDVIQLDNWYNHHHLSSSQPLVSIRTTHKHTPIHKEINSKNQTNVLHIARLRRSFGVHTVFISFFCGLCFCWWLLLLLKASTRQ